MNKMGSIYKCLIVIILWVCIVFVSSFISYRWDLTIEKRFSLSSSTKILLQKVKERGKDIQIDVFLTDPLPSYYKELNIACRNLLEEFKENTDHHIQFRFVLPGSHIFNDSIRGTLYDSLFQMGVILEPKKTTEDNGLDKIPFYFPSAIVQDKSHQRKPIVVDLRSGKVVFKPYDILNSQPIIDEEATNLQASELLEYKFAHAIYQLIKDTIPTIAYCVGNGEPLDATVNDLIQTIHTEDEVAVFDLAHYYPNPRYIQLLLIVKPSLTFSDEDKYKLDQFITHGGKILWAINPLYASLDSLMKKQSDFVAYDRNLNLEDLFFKFGVRINNDLIQDLDCAKIPLVVGVNPDHSPIIKRVPWPYYPFLYAPNTNPITNNLDRVLSQFPSSIDTIAGEDIRKTILLATDTNSRILGSPALVSLNSVRTEADLFNFNKSYIPIAVLLEGKFHSLFAHHATQAQQDSIKQYLNAPFLPQSIVSTQQIVLSNADIITNPISQTQGPGNMGQLPFDDYRFANRDLLMNCVDYLTNPIHLYESRNKQFRLRLLNKIKINENRYFWECIAILPPLVILILFGIIFYEIRKYKYKR